MNKKWRDDSNTEYYIPDYSLYYSNGMFEELADIVETTDSGFLTKYSNHFTNNSFFYEKIYVYHNQMEKLIFSLFVRLIYAAKVTGMENIPNILGLVSYNNRYSNLQICNEDATNKFIKDVLIQLREWRKEYLKAKNDYNYAKSEAKRIYISDENAYQTIFGRKPGKEDKKEADKIAIMHDVAIKHGGLKPDAKITTPEEYAVYLSELEKDLEKKSEKEQIIAQINNTFITLLCVIVKKSINLPFRSRIDFNEKYKWIPVTDIVENYCETTGFVQTEKYVQYTKKYIDADSYDDAHMLSEEDKVFLLKMIMDSCYSYLPKEDQLDTETIFNTAINL